MPTGIYVRTEWHRQINAKGHRGIKRESPSKSTRRKIGAANSKALLGNKNALGYKHTKKELLKMSKAAKRNKTWRKAQRASFLARKKKNGKCCICLKLCFVHKDHCHKTGLDRGTLCFNCNVGLGYFKDSPKLLRKAAKYLIKHKNSHKKLLAA